MILTTGGAGFIGSNFVLDWLADSSEPVLNLDKLTYAGNIENLASLRDHSGHVFVRGDIGDLPLVRRLLDEHRPRAVINFAAESHVDRSIHGPEDFIQTNIVGAFRLLEAVRDYWNGLPDAGRAAFRFLHVSTDEVYGDGRQIRDWLYVKDHCSAIRRVLEAGRVGEVYNVGGWNEKTNLEVVSTLCEVLDELSPRVDSQSYITQITFVADRPGHDRRYAIDASKLERELGWKPAENFDTGIRKTVCWYLANQEWVRNVTSGAYREWVGKQYGN